MLFCTWKLPLNFPAFEKVVLGQPFPSNIIKNTAILEGSTMPLAPTNTVTPDKRHITNLLLLLLLLHECWLTGYSHSHWHSMRGNCTHALRWNCTHPVKHCWVLIRERLLLVLLWRDVHATRDTIHLRLTSLCFRCIQCHYTVCEKINKNDKMQL